MSAGKLYLLPCLLGDDGPVNSLCSFESELLNTLNVFLTENERSCRRFMRKAGFTGSFDELELIHYDKDSSREETKQIIQYLLSGKDAGLISEAGVPSVADPGALLIRAAHIAGIDVIPVPGPSAIFQSITASGLNGQQFSFHGYLPIDSVERVRKLKEIQENSSKTGFAHFFIETPYRNNQLIGDCLKALSDTTIFHIAANISLPNSFIRTMPISNWKNEIPNLHKQPAVFGLISK